MVESIDKVMQTMQAQAGTSAAIDLSAFIEQVKHCSESSQQLSLQRQCFASLGVSVDDDEIQLFYQTTRSLEPERTMHVVQKICSQIVRFRAFGDVSFGYSDWQSVQEIERNYLEFGLVCSEAELFELYQSDVADVFRLFRARIHANLRKMLEVISQESEKIPSWLDDILNAKYGAEAVVLRDSDEREAYKNLLNTLFDSHGLTNRRYLVEQVLDSWSQQ